MFYKKLIAKNLLNQGLDTALISESTGLPSAEVEKLKKELDGQS